MSLFRYRQQISEYSNKIDQIWKNGPGILWFIFEGAYFGNLHFFVGPYFCEKFRARFENLFEANSFF